MSDGLVQVRISAASARLRFLSCGPACIARGCTARCCDAPSSPSGIRVHVPARQRAALAALGAATDAEGFLQPAPGTRRCPFKTEGHLCALFGRPERPLGCLISPFALNSRGLLIVRNRYKLLPCYAPQEGEAAYRVFRPSLDALFGEAGAARVIAHLEGGVGDTAAAMPREIFEDLTSREAALHSQTQETV